MFSYEAPSSSPEALHHDFNMPSNWHVAEALRALEDEITYDTKTLVVTASHTFASIADALGIHSFDHQIASKNLLGCTLTLHPHGVLEIRHPGAQYATSFPVVRRELSLA
jgi:hypothetical protein